MWFIISYISAIKSCKFLWCIVISLWFNRRDLKSVNWSLKVMQITLSWSLLIRLCDHLGKTSKLANSNLTVIRPWQCILFSFYWYQGMERVSVRHSIFDLLYGAFFNMLPKSCFLSVVIPNISSSLLFFRVRLS